MSTDDETTFPREVETTFGEKHTVDEREYRDLAVQGLLVGIDPTPGAALPGQVEDGARTAPTEPNPDAEAADKAPTKSTKKKGD